MGKTTSHFRCIVQNKIYSIAKTGSAYIHYMCRNSQRNQMNMILMCCNTPAQQFRPHTYTRLGMKHTRYLLNNNLRYN